MDSKKYLFSLVLISCSLIAMDQKVGPAPQKMIQLCLLADKSGYTMSEDKVIYESKTLSQYYLAQGKKHRIYIPGISRKEIELFDKALSKNICAKKSDNFKDHFESLSQEDQRTLTIVAGKRGPDGTKKLNAQRLTAQLVLRWLPFAVWSNEIIKKHCHELGQLFIDFKNSMLIDDIQNEVILQLPAYPYMSEAMSKEEKTKLRTIKRSEGGNLKYMPRLEKLEPGNFNGPNSVMFFEHKNDKYWLRNRSKNIDQKNYYVVGSKVENGIVDLREMNLFIGSTLAENLVKTIQHNCRINSIFFSPNDKWLVTFSFFSNGPSNKFMLTCLDQTSQNSYLSDTLLVPNNDITSAFCFNNASTVIVLVKPRLVEFFNIATKQCFASFPLDAFIPLGIIFNCNDSRLVCSLSHPAGANTHTVYIWDTTNFDNIKELQNITISTKDSAVANITFSHPLQDIIAISTDSTTMFFDVNSGKFLSKTEELVPEQDEHKYVATSFLCCSPITCIGMNKGKKSSYVNMYDAISGNCIKTISYELAGLDGIGVTSDNSCLVATFGNGSVIKTSLGTDLLHSSFIEMVKRTGLVSFYGLLQLHRAKKKQKERPNVSQQLYQYIQEDYPPDEECKKLLKKYFAL